MLSRGRIKKVGDDLFDIHHDAASIWHLPEPDSLTGLGKRLVALHDLKSRLKKVASLFHEVYAQAEADLVKSFIENESTGVKVAGKNLFPVQKMGCKKLADGPAVCEALEEAGLGDLVYKQTNVRSLASHFKGEAPDDFLGEPNDLLPDELQGFLELTEYSTVGVRSA